MLLHISYPTSSTQNMIACELCAGLWAEPLSSLETGTVSDFVEGFCGGNVWEAKTNQPVKACLLDCLDIIGPCLSDCLDTVDPCTISGFQYPFPSSLSSDQ